MAHFDLTSLIGYYKFDDNTNDSSGNGIHGTIVGTADFESGQIGQAIDTGTINGTRVELPESNFDFNIADPFSVAFWLKADILGAREDFFLAKGVPDSGLPSWGFGYRPSIGKMRFRIRDSDSGKVITVPTLVTDDGEWHFFVGTKGPVADMSAMKLYVDGNLEVTGTSAVMVGTMLNDNPVTIGSSLNGSDHPGPIAVFDEVSIWGRELSQTEVTALWNGGAGSQLEHLVIKGKTLLTALSRITDLILRKNSQSLVKVQGRLTDLLFRIRSFTSLNTNKRRTDIREKLDY